MLTIESKYRICKRYGSSVFEQCQTQRFAMSEQKKLAQKKGKRKQTSDYGKQMIEKQKARFTYGLSEEQFSKLAAKAMEEKNPAQSLYTALESRLDNVVYRLGLAPTRRAARQMVSHGHITINGKRNNIPSHSVALGTAVAVREASKTRKTFTTRPDQKELRKAASHTSFDESQLAGKLNTMPEFVATESPIDFAAIFEFYTR
jgi:small subunit ribosomal protein S4